MPFEKSNKGGKKKQDGGGWLGKLKRLPGDFARDAEDIVTGMPTGLHELQKAGHKAFWGDTDDLEMIVKQTGRGMYEDVRHPLRNPASTLLTLLGAASLGGGAVARGSAGVSKAAKTGSIRKGARAAAKKPVYTRKFVGVPKKKGQFGKRYEVNASPNPLVRGARKVTLDKAYNASRKRAETGKKGGNYARNIERREKDKRKRYYRQSQEMEARIDKNPDVSPVAELWHAPTNVMRMGMVLRPRYYAQNIAGTGAMLMAQQPLGIGRSISRSVKLRKTDPETYRWAQHTMGEAGAGSVGIGAKGILSTPTKHMMKAANIPESHLRVLALERVARNNGLTMKQLRELHPSSNKWQRIVHEANEAVGDYSRLGGSSKAGRFEESVVRSGLPIFYPMTKAFTRYAARFPSQHSIQSALGAQLGEQGKEAQLEGFGGPLPPWSPYLIPTNPEEQLTKNPQNVYPFSPGADVARQAAQMFTKGVTNPTLSLAANLGPAPELAYGAVTGRSLATGFPLKDVEEMTKLEAALRDFAPTAPGVDIASMLGLLKPRTGAAYEEPTQEELFKMWGAGPAFIDRRTKYDVLRKQGKPKGKKKKHGSKRKSQGF